jgi:hypothetical protein
MELEKQLLAWYWLSDWCWFRFGCLLGVYSFLNQTTYLKVVWSEVVQLTMKDEVFAALLSH